MKKLKVLTVVGTRPEIIRLSRVLARLSLDGQEQLLTENQSIYLPVGAVHALVNPGKIALELIEVQVGSYAQP